MTRFDSDGFCLNTEEDQVISMNCHPDSWEQIFRSGKRVALT